MIVHWADNSTDTFVVARDNSGWTSRDEEVLRKLTVDSASQLDIAVEFPTRKWSRIREKIGTLVGKTYKVSPKPIHDNETYNQYLNRAKDMPHKAGSGERWTDNDVDCLSSWSGQILRISKYTGLFHIARETQLGQRSPKSLVQTSSYPANTS